jgi:hypothetical protein
MRTHAIACNHLSTGAPVALLPLLALAPPEPPPSELFLLVSQWGHPAATRASAPRPACRHASHVRWVPQRACAERHAACHCADSAPIICTRPPPEPPRPLGALHARKPVGEPRSDARFSVTPCLPPCLRTEACGGFPSARAPRATPPTTALTAPRLTCVLAPRRVCLPLTGHPLKTPHCRRCAGPHAPLSSRHIVDSQCCPAAPKLATRPPLPPRTSAPQHSTRRRPAEPQLHKGRGGRSRPIGTQRARPDQIAPDQIR